MTLVIILALMGAGYTILTNSPRPVRQFELTAVWGTLGFIAMALSSELSVLLGLGIATALSTPLWFLAISVSDQYARLDARKTRDLWRRWQARTGSAAITPSPIAAAASATSRVPAIRATPGNQNHASRGGDRNPAPAREFELAPLERPRYSRRSM